MPQCISFQLRQLLKPEKYWFWYVFANTSKLNVNGRRFSIHSEFMFCFNHFNKYSCFDVVNEWYLERILVSDIYQLWMHSGREKCMHMRVEIVMLYRWHEIKLGHFHEQFHNKAKTYCKIQCNKFFNIHDTNFIALK